MSLQRKPITDEEREKIVAFHRQGMAPSAIVKETGRTYSVIHRVLERASGNGQGVLTSSIKPVRGQYPCPECGRKFISARVLGKHRTTHGVKGTSTSTLYRKQQRSQTMGKESTNGYQPHPDSGEITAHISYLYGRFEAHLQDYADRHEIPWKVLASGVAKLLKLRA
jgi:hypothetical protein